MSELEPYFPVAQAINLLLHPHGEVVIHDLKTGKIAAIYNNFSKRKIGDESLLGEEDFPDVFPVYVKTNWDGRLIKSSTATLHDKKGKAIGLLCINLDISQWEAFRHLLDQWLHNQKQPAVLFKDDWREKINTYVSEFLKKEGTVLKALSREKKRELIHALNREGAFQAKNAAQYVGDVLDLSRATIYNYLKACK